MDIRKKKEGCRRVRSRHKISETKKRYRLSVYRSLRHIYAQIIDDEEGRILCSATSLNIDKDGLSKVEVAKLVGNLIAEEALNRDIREVTFDRRSYLYHGRVKALADGGREGGLKF